MTRITLILFKFLVGFLLAAYVLASVDLGSTSDLLLATDIAFMIPSVALMALALLGNAARWLVVTTILTPPIGVGTAILGTFEAVFFQQILPTGLGGDVSRTLRARDAGASMSQAVYGVIIDRANGLLFVALSILGSGLLSNSLVLNSGLFWTLLCCSAGIALGALVAIFTSHLVCTKRLPRPIAALFQLAQEYSRCMRSVNFLLLTLACLLISNALYISSFKYCALAVGVPIGWWDAIIIVQGMVLVTVIPVSIGGWGLREGAALLLFTPLHIDPSGAVAVSVLFGLVLTFLAAIGGVLWLAFGYKRLKHS